MIFVSSGDFPDTAWVQCQSTPNTKNSKSSGSIPDMDFANG